jgi:hypothetical protein
MLFSAEKGVTNGGTIVHCEGEKERKAIDRRLKAEGEMGKRIKG